MRTDAFFIFLYFLKTCVEINALTVTDCSLLRLRKSAYHRQQPLKVTLVTKMANQPLYPIAHPQPYIITTRLDPASVISTQVLVSIFQDMCFIQSVLLKDNSSLNIHFYLPITCIRQKFKICSQSAQQSDTGPLLVCTRIAIWVRHIMPKKDHYLRPIVTFI